METTIKQYKGLEVTLKKTVVDESEIDEQIAYFMQQAATKEEVEGPVANGHITLIDFAGFKDGVAFDGGTAEGYELTIGSGQFIPGFEEQMVGMTKGETRDINVTFPQDYQAAELAGQPVVFKVTVHNIYNKVEAELTDDFVKNLNYPGIETVEHLRNDIRAALQQEADAHSMNQVTNRIMAALVANTETEVTEEELKKETENERKAVAMQLAQQGATIEMYLQATGTPAEVFDAQLAMSAKNQVILRHALDKIAELEKVEVTDEEIEHQMETIASQYGVEIEKVKEMLSKEAVGKDVAYEKIRHILVDSAVINWE